MGKPKVIYTDNDGALSSKIIQQYLTEQSIKQIITRNHANIAERQTKTIKYEDQSKTFRTTEETYIDKNYTGRNGDGYNFAKVRVRTLRKPVFGDKFSSRHGQKGTVGNIIPEEDMPFTANGIRPDLIINPHCIPTRMTIGQIVECLFGKLCVSYGAFGDCTAFQSKGSNYSTYGPQLVEQGFHSSGNDILYNGMTGEQLKADIFIGPTYYQRLKHLVMDKHLSITGGCGIARF